MKYEKLQQAHTLVDGYSQSEQDVLKPFLPALPEQKTLDEIIEDVYEAYMDEENEANSDRLAEIHYQLTNWGKIPEAQEYVFSLADYEELPDGTVVLGRGAGLPWIKGDSAWHSTAGDVRSNEDMAGDPREIVRKGQGCVQ